MASIIVGMVFSLLGHTGKLLPSISSFPMQKRFPFRLCTPAKCRRSKPNTSGLIQQGKLKIGE